LQSGLRAESSHAAAAREAVRAACSERNAVAYGQELIVRTRRVERFRFDTPIAALFGSRRVVVSDLSAIGAGIVHREQLGREDRPLLTFAWEDIRIEMRCSVVRTALEQQQHGGIALTVYHSGLVFEPADASADLDRQLGTRLDDAIVRQRSNAFAIPIESARHLPLLSFDAEESRVVAPSLNLNEFFEINPTASLFVRCRLVHGRWTQETVNAADQPEDGFTVSAAETAEEIETLCWTYQQSDHEGRNLIRTFAHLTITEPPNTPHDLYTA
jgi:hypothetical protein